MTAPKIKVLAKAQNRLALGIIRAFTVIRPGASLEDIRAAFPRQICPDSGVRENFIDVADIAHAQGANWNGYFSKPGELIPLADGREIAVTSMWTMRSLTRLIAAARPLGIEAERTEDCPAQTDKLPAGPAPRGYCLEYLNGFTPGTQARSNPREPATGSPDVGPATPRTVHTPPLTQQDGNQAGKSKSKGLPASYVPSEAELQKYLRLWDNLSDYVDHEKALGLIFRDDPEFRVNTDLRVVIIKCSALNDFYATNIYKTAPVARKIVAIRDIDARLAQGDDALVEEIANVDGRRNYSFATKYCSHHRPDRYPIYDRYVADVLVELRRRNRQAFHFRNRNSLKESYPVFRQAIDDFRKAYGLQGYSYKDVDRYLWQLGKDYYNPYD